MGGVELCGENDGRPGCTNPPDAEEHECPYQSEINGKTVMCTCCDACTHECLMDI
jgi:hypothetical protein